MDETRAVAHLPSVDLEVTHRSDGPDGPESVSVTLTAQHGFRRAAEDMRALGMLPPGFGANPFMPWAALWPGQQLWTDMMTQSWRAMMDWPYRMLAAGSMAAAADNYRAGEGADD